MEAVKLSAAELAAIGCDANGDYNVANITETVEDYRKKCSNKGLRIRYDCGRLWNIGLRFENPP